jgi:hypothetical protein
MQTRRLRRRPSIFREEPVKGTTKEQDEMHAYEEVHPAIDTGDLVLFSGKGSVSTGIRWITGGRWSHVGMAVRIGERDGVMLWEATPPGDKGETESARGSEGVRLAVLRERVEDYRGQVAVRHLTVHRTPEMLAALHSFRREVIGRPYEQNGLELLRSAYEGPFGDNMEELSSVFCSELVAATYQRIGLLPRHPPSNEYTPADFAADAELVLLRGALGPERLITGAREPASDPASQSVSPAEAEQSGAEA